MASISVSHDNTINPNQQQPLQEEPIIPVLTVFKNKAILKNIFIILDNNNNNIFNDYTLLIGRHQNCNIVLTHPSISRFHLQIRFTPSSRSISLLDMSSGISNQSPPFFFVLFIIDYWNLDWFLLYVVVVHGTWVCGKKIEPGVTVDLKQGDTFTLGVSTRVYFLHFVSQLDAEAIKVPFFISILCCSCFYFLHFICVSSNCSFLIPFCSILGFIGILLVT